MSEMNHSVLKFEFETEQKEFGIPAFEVTTPKKKLNLVSVSAALVPLILQGTFRKETSSIVRSSKLMETLC